MFVKNTPWSLITFLIVLAGLAGAGWLYLHPSGNPGKKIQEGKHINPIPVEVDVIKKGPIHLRLTFSGTLEARAEFVVSPKIGGRILSLAVDLSDIVNRGQLVAELDSDEAFQDVLQAKADLAVANATQIETQSSLKIAAREFERIKLLKQRGIASDSQYDSAMANQLVKHSLLEVAKAQVMRGKSLLEAANIRLGYSRVTADWPGDEDQRIVAERYVDEGQTVSANTPLLLISKLEPITGIVHATEKDYASLSPGQQVSLTTDAYPKEIFYGKVDRISPVFNKTTRQARIELAIANPGLKLKPGMFIRATIDVKAIPNATLVPEMAITSRRDQTGVFIVDEKDKIVSWHPVTLGIIEGRYVQVEGNALSGRVVILGQHLLDNGSKISIPDQKGIKNHINTTGNDK